MKQALGILEVRSLSAAIQGADTMLKSASVELLKLDYVGSGIVAVVISGEVAAVQSAVSNAQETVKNMAEIISVNVIPRPSDEVDKLLL